MACVAVGIGLAVWLARDKQPTYKGKNLSHWVCQLRRGSNQEQHDAKVAIKAIGTNATPYLLKWISCQPSRIELDIRSRLSEFFKSVYPESTEFSLSVGARDAFGVLGPNARIVIPQLTRILLNSNSPTTTIQLVADAFPPVDESLAPLLQALSSPNPRTREAAVHAINRILPHLGSSKQAALHPLIAALNDTSPQVANTAAWALGEFKDAPDVVLPALIKRLHTTGPDIRLGLLGGLGKLGPLARPAVPEVLALVHSTGYELPNAATYALLAIAPDKVPDDALKALPPGIPISTNAPTK